MDNKLSIRILQICFKLSFILTNSFISDFYTLLLGKGTLAKIKHRLSIKVTKGGARKRKDGKKEKQEKKRTGNSCFMIFYIDFNPKVCNYYK